MRNNFTHDSYTIDLKQIRIHDLQNKSTNKIIVFIS